MGSIDFPEEKIARKIFDKHNLKIPFDLDQLVRHYADLIYKSIPISGVDGLSLNIKVVGKTPTVIINQDITETRQLFTLAHELGHLIIPWHCGIDIEDIDLSHEWIADFRYGEMEQEANRFAAEILMPKQFIENLSLKEENFASLHDRVCLLTGVSHQAAAIRLGQILPRNIIYCCEVDGIINYSGVSSGTMATIPNSGSINVKTSFPSAVHSNIKIRGKTIHWWQLKQEDVSTVQKDDPRTWKEILDFVASQTENPIKYKQTINGRVSWVNGTLKKTSAYNVSSIYTECLNRFRHLEEFKGFIKYGLLEIFLLKKIEDMVSK